ncbi:MAG: ABC transporter permease subunit, partial [Bdellovibrionota bacterium]
SLGVVGAAKFKYLYAPVCIPPLVYNSILSWSNGWYFLVACEIIAVGPAHYHLPGIGSFLARAAQEERLPLVLWGLLTLTFTILTIDSFVWRPLTHWSERFRGDSLVMDQGLGEKSANRSFLGSGSLKMSRAFRVAGLRILRIVSAPLLFFFRDVIVPLVWDLPIALMGALAEWLKGTFLPRTVAWFLKSPFSGPVFWTLGTAIFFFALARTAYWLRPPWPEFVAEIPLAILYSTGRIAIGLLISLSWTVPVVLLVWNRPRIREALTTLAQVGASLPAIALFPLVVVLALRRVGGGMEIATLFLLVTGMQWYLLFNLLSGAASIPSDLTEAARSMGLPKILLWKRLVLPAMRPSLVTGLITAWGGGWNALVVSEYVIVKDEKLTETGIGALVSRAVYELGDHRSVALCVTSMIVWILLFNSFVWRPMMARAVDRFRMDL